MKLSKVFDGIVLQRTYRNFLTLLRTQFSDVNKAHLLMLKKTKILSEVVVSKIKTGLIQFDQIADSPERKPEDVEDYFFYFEKVLPELIAKASVKDSDAIVADTVAEIAGSLHTARSRNDLDCTLFRMYMREAILSFVTQGISLLETMSTKVTENLSTPIVLYTHGQPAQISSFAHYIHAMIQEVIEVLENFLQAYSIVNRCAMGACAITTSGFPIDRFYISDLLGFDEPVPNSYQAISTSHWLLMPAVQWSCFLNDLTRFIEDIAHKSSFEVGILQFPDDLVQVSSIMPQKRNPVILEHIRIKAGIARSLFCGFDALFHNTAYQDINENGDATLQTLHQALTETEEAITLFQETILKVSVNISRVRQIAKESGITVTEVADEIVRREKIGFRTAHGIVSAFVRSGFSYESLEKGFEEKIGRPFPFTRDDLTFLLSPDHFIQVRKVYGGPAMEAMNDSVLQKIKQLRLQVGIQKELLREKREIMLAAFREL